MHILTDKQLIQIIFLFLTSFVFGQNYIDYYNEANEAEYQFVEGNHPKTIAILSKLEKQYGKLLNKDNFYLGMAYYLDRDSINGLNYLLKFTEDFGPIKKLLEDCERKFTNLIISKYSKIQLATLQEKLYLTFKDSVTYNSIYKPTIDSLKSYVILDQKNRNDTGALNGEEDKRIQAGFLNYLKKYGIPPPNKYGDEALLVICAHVYYPEIKEKYLNFFLDEIKKGNISPFYYATIIDRGLAGDKKETIYGAAWIKTSESTSKDKIIENRKKIGMSPYFLGPNNLPKVYKQVQN